MAHYAMSLLRVSKILPPRRQIIKDISPSFFPGVSIGYQPQEPQLDTYKTVPEVEGFPVMRHGHIVYQPDKPLLPVARAFKEFLLGQAHA